MKILPHKATDVQLNWMVAQAMELAVSIWKGPKGPYLTLTNKPLVIYNPVTYSSQGFDVIERGKFDFFWNTTSGKWSVCGWDRRAKRAVTAWNVSLLRATCECLVLTKYGDEDEIEVPEDLV